MLINDYKLKKNSKENLKFKINDQRYKAKQFSEL